ncbi:colicin E3/pyocin S6 family cytotoxin [Emticicia sp. 21SJ11W-3]|uniref:colicin E3/pyocin S6 family cytotoxin n=1 Tax=Emticicia sp. 21SJ11W-3 TaxID=2916755 RepID=UPI00209D7D6E|nr:colicin E3/pyocin S6 family cytotoxin [Emticicia sp. 21SJ11W-3]UTA66876.1 colicin E3/pyocin S6 family cytotoxin [Emticicia sp. 21SJ11W-3]
MRRISFGARTYNANIGRFDRVDPLADNYYSLSPYNYVGNNPVKNTDPTGMSCKGCGKDGEDITPLEINGHYAYIGTCPICPNSKEYDIFRDSKSLFTYDSPTGIDFNGEGSAIVTLSRQNNPASSILAGGMMIAGALAADDVTGIGVLDDPAIPVVLAGTAIVEGITYIGYEIYQSYNPDNSPVNYHVPPKTLPGFPDARRDKPKSGRARWVLPDGKILEWDYQHGDVEVYNNKGKHQGSADPNTGEMTKEPVPGRTTQK